MFSAEFNDGFKLPKSDACKTCDSFNIKIYAESDENKKKEMNMELELHQWSQTSLNEEVENAKLNKNKDVISLDHQQTLPTPLLPAFFCKPAKIKWFDIIFRQNKNCVLWAFGCT